MVLLAVVFVVLVGVTIGAGALAHLRNWSPRGGPTAWGVAAASRFGALRAAALIAAFGWLLTAIVGLAMGFLAKALESGVDRPIFDWVYPRVSNSLFTRINDKLTLMGSSPIVEVVVLISFIILVCAYKGRRWLPAVAIVGAFFAEKLIQKVLGSVVDRGHPPTTLGTYPSGGVGRLLGIYSVVVVLVIVLMPTLNRAWRAGLWTGLVTAGVVEAFTRVYLSKHWFTDAAFALVFGAMLLLVNIAVVSALTTAPKLALHRPGRPDDVHGVPEVEASHA